MFENVDIAYKFEPHDFRGAERECSHVYSDGTKCGMSLWQHRAAAANDPNDPCTWTKDYKDGWSAGFGAGIKEGLCRARRFLNEKVSEYLERTGG